MMSRIDHAKWLVRRWIKGARSGEIRRGAAYKLISPFASIVGVDRGFGVYLVPTADLTGLRTFMMGHYELDVMGAALETLSTWIGRPAIEDRIIIEVGANIGTTTVPALRDFGARHIVAIEPDPGNVRLLRANLILNDLEQSVTVVQAAVSDVEGIVEFEISDDSVGDHRVRTKTTAATEMGESDRAIIEVRARRLDGVVADAVENVADVGLIWMDVQGHEGQVLAGASKLIQAGIPVMTEYWPYGLKRGGGLDVMHRIMKDDFTTVIDVRSGPHGRQIPREEIVDLASKYPTFDTYTDLLLIP